MPPQDDEEPHNKTNYRTNNHQILSETTSIRKDKRFRSKLQAPCGCLYKGKLHSIPCTFPALDRNSPFALPTWSANSHGGHCVSIGSNKQRVNLRSHSSGTELLANCKKESCHLWKAIGVAALGLRFACHWATAGVLRCEAGNTQQDVGGFPHETRRIHLWRIQLLSDFLEYIEVYNYVCT